MSFDINPLVHTLHLQQLEREMAQIHAAQQADAHEETRAKARPASLKSRLHLAIHSLWPRAAV